MSKIAVYCRVATKEQCGSKTLLAQRISCERYARINSDVFEKYKKIVEESNKTKYRLAKDSCVAYTTINDICSGKA